MHIEYNFNFTPSAAAAAKAHGLSSFSFSHQAGAPDRWWATCFQPRKPCRWYLSSLGGTCTTCVPTIFRWH